ncbi:MAG: (cytosine-5)-methyltransferase 1 [Nocardioidaceae bacterium]|nr:(cytosine-5)-methyltransferase 1 [Nocardioidaceae bacterium]
MPSPSLSPARDAGKRRSLEPYRVLDLFAGAGGLTRAFHDVGGFTTVCAVESDVAAAASFAANFGDVVHEGRIQDWLADHEVPTVDIVVGGPPCQGFSRLGKLDAHDERNELWREYAKTVARARPSYFVVENVAAFLRSPQFSLLEHETGRRGSLREYAFRAAVLNSADFGAPQARRRAVVLGHHRDLPFPGFPEPTHIGKPRTVRDAFRGLRRKVERIELPDRSTTFGGWQLPGVYRSRELHLARTYSGVSKARIRSIPPGGNRFDIPDRLLPRCWREHLSGSADVMGRLRWDQPSVTIRTEFYKPEKGRYLHPDEDRALTLFEAARLQGFPDDHRWVGSKTAIARQIGNAVPIALGSALARQLAQQALGRP